MTADQKANSNNFMMAVPVRMKAHPEFSEAWLQSIIAKDPKILGLGDLQLYSRERRHPRAGRLDLLLCDEESGRRYEVEIQLGVVDEAHIIRTIEYWDIERKRYPQHDHCAVIIAETMTARFLNIIGLFNGHIPLIAIQVQLIRVGENVTLVFTKVLDELTRGDVEELSFDQTVQIDIKRWEEKFPQSMSILTKEIYPLIEKIDKRCELNSTKNYISIMRDKVANNFAIFRPRKKSLLVQLYLPYTNDYTEMVEKSGLDMTAYDARFKYYGLHVREDDLANKGTQLSELLKAAYMERNS